MRINSYAKVYDPKTKCIFCAIPFDLALFGSKFSLMTAIRMDYRGLTLKMFPTLKLG